MKSYQAIDQVMLRAIHQLREELPGLLGGEAVELDREVQQALEAAKDGENEAVYQGALEAINRHLRAARRLDAIIPAVMSAPRAGFFETVPAGDGTATPLPGDEVVCPQEAAHYRGLLLWKNQRCEKCGALLVLVAGQ